MDDYLAACTACEIKVLVKTAAMLRNIKLSLFYDRRKKGAHGRALRFAISGTTLMVGDRLEPTLGMPDVAMVDDFDASSLPVTLTFW